MGAAGPEATLGELAYQHDEVGGGLVEVRGGDGWVFESSEADFLHTS